MQAYSRLASAAPAPYPVPAPSAVPSPSIPATSEHEHSSPEPYWPRVARALVLMFFAICLHIWGVHSPEPQEPLYASLASRLVASVLVSPPVPVAPPLQLVASRTFGREQRVSVRSTLLNVPTVPGPPASSLAAAVDHLLVPVGTSGTTIDWTAAADTPRVTPSLAPPAPPARTTLDDAPPVASLPEHQPAPMTVAAMAIPLRETRIALATPSVDRLALSPNRVTLPADRKEADPRDRAADQSHQKEVVLAVVREYAHALERLDVRATKAVYPSVDDRQLQRAFQGLKEQQFHFASCGVSLSSSGDDANAWCKGNATYRPKVGSRTVQRLTSREWVFNLARDGGGWQILEARVQ